MPDDATLRLLDRLIGSWSSWSTNREYYLTVLAPRIAESTEWAWLPAHERLVVEQLRDRLSADEWDRVPELIAERLQWLTDGPLRARQAAEARAEAERRAAAARRQEELRLRALIERLQRAFISDFLSSDEAFTRDQDHALLSQPEYERLKAAFVYRWVREELDRSLHLDMEQAHAVATTSGNVAVTARAGSGKTRTLVARAVFLQRHCGVSPRETLLLAFNGRAVEEMRERLHHALGEELPFVMTFHALAYRLVHPDRELIYDDAVTEQFAQSRILQRVIDYHITSVEFGSQIRDLMLAHFREDWERIVDGRMHLTMEEFLSYRRSLPRESLRGEYVKSFGERVIANALFEHGVDYFYERNRRWDDTNYRPDFTIPTGDRRGLAIEYFGLEDDADYDDMTEQKRAYWTTQPDWTLLEYSPHQLSARGEAGFVETLLADLRGYGVNPMRRSEEEIWELTRERAIDSFTRAMATFVGRVRKRDLTPAQLDELIQRHHAASIAERLFLSVASSVYRGYLQQLDKGGQEDFDGLMWSAVAGVRAGRTRFSRARTGEQGDLSRLRFVMIDEFQDFNDQFFNLTEAMRTQNPAIRLFCVGDDWQAINGFAGADPRFLNDFERYFEDAARRTVATNYRSVPEVVATGNALMRGKGVPAEPRKDGPGTVWLGSLDRFRPTTLERAQHGGDEITPAVLRLVTEFLRRGVDDVVLLTRRHGLPWYVNERAHGPKVGDAALRFLEHVRSFLPEEDRGRVTASTTHGYKGLEHGAVVILDALDRSYPLLHPHWVFLRVFGGGISELEAEERRLFYVAVTRAEHTLVLLTEDGRKSPYIAEIEQDGHLERVPWDRLAPAPWLDGQRLEIRVANAVPLATLAVRDALKDLGYRWDARGKYWARAVLAEGFSLDALRAQPWASAPNLLIEVYSEENELLDRFRGVTGR